MKLSPLFVFDYLSVVGMGVRLTVACVPPPSGGRHGTPILSPQTYVVVFWQRATFGFRSWVLVRDSCSWPIMCDQFLRFSLMQPTGFLKGLSTRSLGEWIYLKAAATATGVHETQAVEWSTRPLVSGGKVCACVALTRGASGDFCVCI